MTSNFTFYSPKILFGRDTFNDLPAEIKAFGTSVLVMTGKTAMRKAGIIDRLEKLLTEEKITYHLMETVDPEPTIEHIEEALEFLSKNKVDSVVGLGGGSVLDVAKAVAGVFGHITEEKVQLRDFIGHDITIPGLPYIAIPTTAGTGSEVTKNSVIVNKQTNIKSSIFRSPSMIPKVALVDPVLTLSMPPQVTAASGMDALTQAIEAYVTRKENPLCVVLALESIQFLGSYLQLAVENGSDIEIREKIAYGSLISALSFSNSSLGAVHGLAHPLGAHLHAPHGVICALLLPHVMEFNKNTKPQRFAKIGVVLNYLKGLKDISSKSENELIELGINFIKELLNSVKLPTKLSELGLKEEHIPKIVKDTKGSSLNNNPRKAGPKQLSQILKNAL